MTKNWIMSLCSLLIACSCWCQVSSADSANRYPRYVVDHGDTVAELTVSQLRQIAINGILLDECDSISSIMQSELDARIALDSATDAAIARYHAIAVHDEALFAAYQQQQKLDANELANIRKQAKLAAIKSKLLGWGIGVPTVSAVGVGGFILGSILKLKL